MQCRVLSTFRTLPNRLTPPVVSCTIKFGTTLRSSLAMSLVLASTRYAMRRLLFLAVIAIAAMSTGCTVNNDPGYYDGYGYSYGYSQYGYYGYP